MTTHNLDNIHPFVTIEVSKRAKRLALRLDAQNRVIRFIVPHRASRRKAQEFLDHHEDWIHERIDNLPDPVIFHDGAILPLFGEDYTLKINQDITLRSTRIIMIDNDIIVSTNKDNPSSRITRFLKTMAKDKITLLSHEKAAIIKKRIKSIQVRDTKTRWGSCSSAGSLSYSWRLIFAPYIALDYVVAHEVAHLKHLDHGKKFWALCEELSDHYKDGKSWMKMHGHTLMRYGFDPDNQERLVG